MEERGRDGNLRTTGELLPPATNPDLSFPRIVLGSEACMPKKAKKVLPAGSSGQLGGVDGIIWLAALRPGCRYSSKQQYILSESSILAADSYSI